MLTPQTHTQPQTPQHNAPSPGTLLRAQMDKGIVAAPGAFSALCALAIAQAGFSACYISGAATSVSAGVPDVGLLGLADFCREIRAVHQATGLPVLADADTGFGEAEMVRKTVIEYSLAGAAGLHLEDQQFPKRCGHLDGKALVPTDHMAEKVAWASRTAQSCGDGGFIVCARTDARGVEGMEAAVERASAYVSAGADMVFPEGLASAAEFAHFSKALRARFVGKRVYMLANMTEFGKTPLIPLDEFAAMGYDIVIYPVSMLRVAMGAVTSALQELKRTGTVAGVLDNMQTRAELYGAIGYTPGQPWEARVR